MILHQLEPGLDGAVNISLTYSTHDTPSSKQCAERHRRLTCKYYSERNVERAAERAMRESANKRSSRGMSAWNQRSIKGSRIGHKR
jgi:hypothetical protein